ncbi:MAG: glycosyltransferase family 2 protein [Solirubrobacteraceae bacterium]
MRPPDAALELSVIVVAHNGGTMLQDAVAALQRNTACTEAEVIVVDSGSSDGSSQRLADGPLPVRVIQCAENVGFCRGNNLGAEAAHGRLVCFTQPDGQVQERWDVALRSALDDPGVVAAGGLVLKMGGGERAGGGGRTRGEERIDSAGIAIAPNLAAWSVAENLTPAQAGLLDGDPREVVGVSPAFLMTRRSDHRSIGGFWEKLWLYGDEPDYALRIGRLGTVVLCPQSRMLHLVGGVSGAHQSPLRLYQSSRNRLLNIARHLPARRVPGAVALAAVFDALQFAQQRNLVSARAVSSGWMAGLRGMRSARGLSTPAERSRNVPRLATLREAVAQQRALGRASPRRAR